ncbi:hypothetical protein Gura_3262 [Geotalea uraniireducens Rf4]|uniref:Uncharacterized protein n=1 Tax=Geotalea uraniireducens (strain Rf4) TaxID=351605 RepID=A5G6K5_GEOUR|nr:hypothetical protein Gura_3262 [Geotalea uraniireducens Rf4]
MNFGAIRNIFAHSHLNLSFGDADVTKLVNSLTFPSVLAAVRIQNGNAQHPSITPAVEPLELANKAIGFLDSRQVRRGAN